MAWFIAIVFGLGLLVACFKYRTLSMQPSNTPAFRLCLDFTYIFTVLELSHEYGTESKDLYNKVHLKVMGPWVACFGIIRLMRSCSLYSPGLFGPTFLAPWRICVHKHIGIIGIFYVHICIYIHIYATYIICNTHMNAHVLHI